jgi:hypothetical protein
VLAALPFGAVGNPPPIGTDVAEPPTAALPADAGVVVADVAQADDVGVLVRARVGWQAGDHR